MVLTRLDQRPLRGDAILVDELCPMTPAEVGDDYVIARGDIFDEEDSVRIRFRGEKEGLVRAGSISGEGGRQGLDADLHGRVCQWSPIFFLELASQGTIGFFFERRQG